MKNQIILVLLLILLISSCTEKKILNNDDLKEIELDYCDSSTFELNIVTDENEFQNIYLERGIKQRYAVISDYEKGKIVNNYIEFADYFDSLGYLEYTKFYFSDDTLPAFIVKCEYDSLNRMIAEASKWKDRHSFDKTVYNYEDNLIEIIDYTKDSLNTEYQLENKTKVIYKKGLIDLLLTEDNDTVSYYIHKGNYSFKYSKTNKLVTEFKNGFIIKVYDISILSFERNSKGNLLKITSQNVDKKIEYTINYEYDNELLTRVTTFSGTGEVSSISDYKYVD